MSQFEKIIIPLIEPKLKPIDFTDKTGFIGCYTFDPDRPSFDKEFFIVFNNNILPNKLFLTSGGAFILLGILMAIINHFKGVNNNV